MTDWTLLSNTAVGVGGLPSGATVTALRDNPIAISEGAVGAPRVLDAALDTTATTAGTAWVTARSDGIAGVIAGYSTGAVGSYAFLVHFTGGPYAPGATLAGSSLRYTSTALSNGGTPSGSWRCMGHGHTFESQRYATLWLRIS